MMFDYKEMMFDYEEIMSDYKGIRDCKVEQFFGLLIVSANRTDIDIKKAVANFCQKQKSY